jgi:hypothetical protein
MFYLISEKEDFISHADLVRIAKTLVNVYHNTLYYLANGELNPAPQRNRLFAWKKVFDYNLVINKVFINIPSADYIKLIKNLIPQLYILFDEYNTWGDRKNPILTHKNNCPYTVVVNKQKTGPYEKLTVAHAKRCERIMINLATQDPHRMEVTRSHLNCLITGPKNNPFTNSFEGCYKEYAVILEECVTIVLDIEHKNYYADGYFSMEPFRDTRAVVIREEINLGILCGVEPHLYKFLGGKPKNDTFTPLISDDLTEAAYTDDIPEQCKLCKIELFDKFYYCDNNAYCKYCVHFNKPGFLNGKVVHIIEHKTTIDDIIMRLPLDQRVIIEEIAQSIKNKTFKKEHSFIYGHIYKPSDESTIVGIKPKETNMNYILNHIKPNIKKIFKINQIW